MSLTPNSTPPGFDKDFALQVALPLAKTAYAVMQDPTANPTVEGYRKIDLIRVHPDLMTEVQALFNEVDLFHLMPQNSNVFGLVGKNDQLGIGFVSFRGTQTAIDWADNLTSEPTPYSVVNGVGDVHRGFYTVYQGVRQSIVDRLAEVCAGCKLLLITGHSLGGALAVLSALDLMRALPQGMELAVLTLAGPRSGCVNFSRSFNDRVKVCYRVVATADLVPHVPAPVPPKFPFEHVGTEIKVDQGTITDPLTAHSLDLCYTPGLENLKPLAEAQGV